MIDQQHRLPAVEQVVPVDARAVQPVRDDAQRRIEQEQPQHGGDRRRHRVGPDEQRLVDRGAAHDPVGEHREDQRDHEAEHRHQQREHGGHLERAEVVLVVVQVAEVVEPDELQAAAERILDEHRLVDRLARRPEEEHDRDGDLRQDQRVGQPPRPEADALFHRHGVRLPPGVGRRRAGRRRTAVTPSRYARTSGSARCRGRLPRRGLAGPSSCRPRCSRAPRR